jgi:GT2 family glycosyltransferase
MYDLDAEYLWFLDDDVVAPPTALCRMAMLLEKHPEFSLVSAIVPSKAEDPEPHVYRGHRPGAYWHWTAGETFEIDQCGMACCLIRKDAFNQIPEPWFSWEKHTDTGGFHEVGEDIGFCERLRKTGGRLLADGGTICGHLDEKGTLFTFSGTEPPFKRGEEWVKSRKKPVPA